MKKYKIEAGIENKTSLSTVIHFSNAKEAREYINGLDDSIWWVLEYSKTGQRIVKHNYLCHGTVYNEGIKCPVVLMGL